MQAALERAMERLAFGPAIDPRDPIAVRAWLTEAGMQAPDIDAIMQGGAERLVHYRVFIRSRLRGVLQLGISHTMARMGDLFEEYFDRFLAEHGPRSHVLVETQGEFLAFCERPWRADPRVPPWMMDLARHEHARHEVGWLPSSTADCEPRALAIDDTVRFIAALRLMRHDWAVHHLLEDEGAGHAREPEARSTSLLVYRDSEHRVRMLELDPLASSIVERLLAGASLRRALVDSSVIHGKEIDDEIVGGAAALLAALAERGILLGASGG